jgi:excisionase family DNA binding protein
VVVVDKQTVSVREAARILGIGRDTAYEAARTGQLPTIRFGKVIRVPIAALDKLLAEAGQRNG